MVDFAKIRLRGRRHRHYRRALRSHPLLTWSRALHYVDHPMKERAMVAELEGWTFYAVDQEVIEIRGSFHKYAHQGANWQDFTHSHFVAAVNRFCDTFSLFPGALHLLNLEVGVNIAPPIPTRDILERVLFHRMKQPARMATPAIGIEIIRKGHYRYKIYDKAAHCGLPDELLRFEVHVDRMSILDDIGIVTAADLLDPASWQRMGEFLLGKFDELFIVEGDIDLGAVTRPQAELLANARLFSFWRGLSANKRNRKRAKVDRLWREHARPYLRGDMRDRLAAKVADLATLVE